MVQTHAIAENSSNSRSAVLEPPKVCLVRFPVTHVASVPYLSTPGELNLLGQVLRSNLLLSLFPIATMDSRSPRLFSQVLSSPLSYLWLPLAALVNGLSVNPAMATAIAPAAPAVAPRSTSTAIALPTAAPPLQVAQVQAQVQAQAQPAVPDNLPLDRDQILPGIRPQVPSEERLPEQSPPQLPPPEELLPAPLTPTPPEDTPDAPATVRIERFNVVGSTVFSAAELNQVLQPFTGRDLSFAELLQARSAVTKLYVDRGYVTSGAFIPPQTLADGVVTIQVVEGSLEGINVTGLRRLQSAYVRDRLALATRPPLNVNRLLEGLQLLQLNPLIRNISADLQAGARPGTSLLQVEVREADSFNTTFSANNGRSPSVGSFRRQVQLTEANLLGFGDSITVGYTNTDGSNGIDASYTLPLNPRNGTLRLAFGTTDSNVIESPFNALDINATSRYYELSLRQPLLQSPTEEFALGLTFSRQESQTELGLRDANGDRIGPFRLSPGADGQGRTRVSALRFFQEWTKRSSQQVLAARSQLSLGLDWLDATVNRDEPDSRFLAWRGQGQWVRLLAPETLLLIRGDVQLADGHLLPLEQFGLGGQESVRGYRQDVLLTDNGALLSAEVRIPIIRIGRDRGIIQLVPFLDLGTTWNNQEDDPNPNSLIGTGLGLLWRQGDDFTARLDWGIPLVDVDSNKRTWQENGIYFSIVYTPF